MKSPLLITLATATLLLSSCGNVKTTLATARENTVATLQAAKEKSLGRDDTKVRLTKADPSRFLPANTKAKTLLEQSKPQKEKVKLLAKNERSSPRAKDKPTDFESFPPLELPALPIVTEDMGSSGLGILPALNGNDSPSKESDAPLPPLPTPEEILAEQNEETSA